MKGDNYSTIDSIDQIDLNLSTKLTDFKPNGDKSITAKEQSLLEFTCGYRDCSDETADRLINYYLVSIGGVITFILLSIEPVDRFLTNLIPNYIARFIFKAVILFIVIYLLDRWIESWRKEITLCHVGL